MTQVKDPASKLTWDSWVELMFEIDLESISLVQTEALDWEESTENFGIVVKYDVDRGLKHRG